MMLYLRYISLLVTTILVLTSCASQVRQDDQPQSEPLPHETEKTKVIKPKVDKRIFHDKATPQILVEAESTASPAAARLLAQAHIMAVDKKVVIRGGCWDYINAVWNKAGYPIKKRVTAFKHGKRGPYAKTTDIRAGDWLYFINRSYHNTEHSAMFITWANRAKMQGYTLSYAGQRRREPARYKVYDLKKVYQITRPKE